MRHYRLPKVLINSKNDWKKSIGNILNKSDIQAHIVYDDLKKVDLTEYDVILPTQQLSDYNYLNKMNMEHPNFLIARESVIQLCHDKLGLSNYLRHRGFGKFLPKILNSPNPPFFLKSRTGQNGRDIFNVESLIGLSQEMQGKISAKDFFMEEPICGEIEYTFHFLYTQKSFKYLCTHKFEFEDELFVKGKMTKPQSRTIVVSEYLDLFSNILDALDYYGVGCFNFKILKGTPKIFELNPRVGRSLSTDIIRFLPIYINEVINSNDQCMT